ncbi:MAG: cation-translocating P-type ATPase, partial [Planctomycetales bacterium]|nr:cation-translocating P-type ATPase [Planctomycetales bacterium]
GDGLNDAPALAAADVGIALACGVDLTRDSAEVCLLSDGVSRVPWAIGLARQTIRTIRQNLIWTLAYNAIGIALAMANLLNPVFAGAAMVVSCVVVVGNSLRLARYDSAPKTRVARQLTAQQNEPRVPAADSQPEARTARPSPLVEAPR